LPDGDFTPASVKIGFLQTPVKKHSFAHSAEQVNGFSLKIDHFKGENPLFPRPSRLPKGVNIRTIMHMCKGEFDPYTFNPFQHMLKAVEKRGSQICIPVPQMSVLSKSQKLTNPDAPSLTRQQHEDLLAKMERRFADSYNRSAMAFQCLEEDDGVAGGLYDLDVMFQNMAWAAEIRRQRVALFYQLPDLAVEPETEDVFITQNMAGNFAATIKSATDFSLFLEKNVPKSLPATSAQAGSTVTSSLPVGAHTPATVASPSTSVPPSIPNAIDVAKDATTRQEIVNLIREEMRAARKSFGGGRGTGGGGGGQNRGGGGAVRNNSGRSKGKNKWKSYNKNKDNPNQFKSQFPNQFHKGSNTAGPSPKEEG
jgi:hypothetical protein